MVRLSRDSLPKVGLPFDWRWFFYAPLLAVAVGIFVFGSCSKNDQFVTFDGRMLQSGEQSQGTLLEFDGDDLESGSLSTMADELFPRVSEGAPLLIVLNGEAAKCPELIPLETDGQDRFGNEESLTVRCEKGSASLVTVKNVSLELGFQEPTNMRAQARSASSISIEATGRFDIFPASLEVIYSFDPSQIPEARRTDCGGLLQGTGIRPAVVITVVNQLKVPVTFNSTTIYPWVSVAKRQDLCILFESVSESETSRFKLFYSQTSPDVSSTHEVSGVKLSHAGGVIDVAGRERTLLSADSIEVRTGGVGSVSITDERISFRIPKARSALKFSGDNRESTNLRRPRIDTWSPYVQVIVGVLISGLGVQVAIRLIVPFKLRKEPFNQKKSWRASEGDP